jgi:esterase/lipase superfamily enzyme
MGNAQFSPPRFQQFLALALGELGASWVHAIAHSMGNEVLVNALRDFDAAALPEGAARLDQIIFAAPDIDAQTFRDLAAKFTTRAKRFTLYASSRDMALLASQAIHKYPRAGQAGEGLVVVDGVETIDASELDTGLMSHSYIGDHTSILSDIFYLLRRGKPGDRFGLVEMASPLGRYWAFVPQGK